jgi:predicted trehalose synthase
MHSAIRRALGISRRAIANHGKADAPPDAPAIGAALGELHATLTTARERPSP